MGQSQSTAQEQIFHAVSKNNVTALAQICGQIQAQNPNFDHSILSFRDAAGRTPLMIAAARNYHNAAGLLLRYGADVHYVCTNSKECAGSALHEAAKNKNESIVELLLQHGGNPFVCNAAGRTALDEAVLAGAANIVRRFEQQAMWSGTAQIKMSKLAGLTTEYKARHMVVVQVFPCPKEGTTEPVRKQLWVFRNAACATPKFRVWLDGATAFRAGAEATTEGIIRLHANHVQPHDVYTRYDRGYCLYLRPGVPNSPVSVASFDQLLATCNINERLLGSSQGLALVTGSDADRPSAPAVARVSSASGAAAPGTVRISSASSTGGHPPPHTAAPATPGLQYYPSIPVTGTGTPLAGDAPGRTAGVASPSPYSEAPPAPAPARPTPLAQVPSPGRTAPGGPVLSPNGVQRQLLEAMQALPGETDEEFAQRLGCIMSALDAPSPAGPRPQLPTPSAPSAPTYTIVSQGQNALPRSPQRSASRTSMASASDRTSIPGANSSAGGASTAYAPSTSTSGGGASVGGAPISAGGDCPAKPVEPSAPVAAPKAAEEELCVICLEGKRECGFLHGLTVHKCVCTDCGTKVAVGNPCPLCRQPVQAVLNVF